MFRTSKTSPPGEDKNSGDRDLKDQSRAKEKTQNGQAPSDAPPANRAAKAAKAPAPRPKSFRGKFVSAPGRSQRRAARVGLLLIVGIAGISGGVLVLHRSNIMTTVYFAQRSIPSGAVINSSDIGAVRIPLPGIRDALPESAIVGRSAAESILPGEIFTNGLASSSVVSSSDVVLGVSLAQGRLPASGLALGARVEVIDTSTSSSSAPSDPVLAQGIVSSVVPGANGSGTLVDLILPSSAAPSVAVAAANTGIALAREN